MLVRKRLWVLALALLLIFNITACSTQKPAIGENPGAPVLLPSPDVSGSIKPEGTDTPEPDGAPGTWVSEGDTGSEQGGSVVSPRPSVTPAGNDVKNPESRRIPVLT